MDNFKIKEEPREEEITIEYNDLNTNKTPKIEDITDNQTITAVKNERIFSGSKSENRSLHETPKDSLGIKTHTNIKNLPYNINAPLHSKANAHPKNDRSNLSILQNGIPSSSNTNGINFSPPFDGVKFMNTQVHSNSVLQLLLKDIVNLNNEKDDEDEDIITQEIERLRSKNNLPSFKVEDNTDFTDSDYGEGSEDELCSNQGSKGSESNGKDSGYENESHHSESMEDDGKSEIQEDNGDTDIFDEPEYIDLDNYFGAKNMRLDACFQGSLAEIRNMARYFHEKIPKNSHEVQSTKSSDRKTSDNMESGQHIKVTDRKTADNLASGENRNSSDRKKSDNLTCLKRRKTFQTTNTYNIHLQNELGCLKKTETHEEALAVKKCACSKRRKTFQTTNIYNIHLQNTSGCLKKTETETHKEALVVKKSAGLKRRKTFHTINTSNIHLQNESGGLKKFETETHEETLLLEKSTGLKRRKTFQTTNTSNVHHQNESGGLRKFETETHEEAIVVEKSAGLNRRKTFQTTNTSNIHLQNESGLKKLETETHEEALVVKKSTFLKRRETFEISTTSNVHLQDESGGLRKLETETDEEALVVKKSEPSKHRHYGSIHRYKPDRKKEELAEPRCEKSQMLIAVPSKI